MDAGAAESDASAEMPLGLYYDVDLAAVVAVDRDGAQLAAEGSYVVWSSGDGDEVVVLRDELGRPSELYADGTTFLFRHLPTGRMDVAMIRPDGGHVIARDIEATGTAPPSSGTSTKGIDLKTAALVGESEIATFMKEAAFALKVGACAASVTLAPLGGVGIPSIASTCGSLVIDAIVERVGRANLTLANDTSTWVQSCALAKNAADALACGVLALEKGAVVVNDVLKQLRSQGEWIAAADRELYVAAPELMPAGRPVRHIVVADFNTSPAGGPVPLELELDGRVSSTSDPRGIRSYEWKLLLQNDSLGAITVGSGPFATPVIRSPGRHTLMLRTTSVGGVEDTTKKIVVTYAAQVPSQPAIDGGRTDAGVRDAAAGDAASRDAQAGGNCPGGEKVTADGKAYCLIREIGYDIYGTYLYEGGKPLVQLNRDGSGIFQFHTKIDNPIHWGIEANSDGTPVVTMSEFGARYLLLMRLEATPLDSQGKPYGYSAGEWVLGNLTISFQDRKMYILGEREKSY